MLSATSINLCGRFDRLYLLSSWKQYVDRGCVLQPVTVSFEYQHDTRPLILVDHLHARKPFNVHCFDVTQSIEAVSSLPLSMLIKCYDDGLRNIYQPLQGCFSETFPAISNKTLLGNAAEYTWQVRQVLGPGRIPHLPSNSAPWHRKLTDHSLFTMISQVYHAPFSGE